MTRRYGWIALAVVLGVLVVTAIVRAPRRAAEPAPAAPDAPSVTLALELTDGAIEPANAQVPLGHRVRLEVAHRGTRATTLALAGYEGRVRFERIEPGTTVRAEFVADLPGEAFAWTIDGELAGRLAVTGSHLPEGHR